MSKRKRKEKAIITRPLEAASQPPTTAYPRRRDPAVLHLPQQPGSSHVLRVSPGTDSLTCAESDPRSTTASPASASRSTQSSRSGARKENSDK